MIKNLSQLKKAINNGASFKIIEHYIHPEYTGQIRKPNIIQTNGFYSIVPNDPKNEVTEANNGKGSWFEYGKVSDWKFENGICYNFRTLKGYPTEKVWAIEIIE